MRRAMTVVPTFMFMVACAANPATKISLPMAPDALTGLQEATRGRDLTLRLTGGAEVMANDVTFSPMEASFLGPQGQTQTIALVPGMSVEYRSAARGARVGFARGFWTLAAVSGFLFVKTGGGEGDGEWLLPFMAATGVVGGGLGGLFGAANGGAVRFEFVEPTNVGGREMRLDPPRMGPSG